MAQIHQTISSATGYTALMQELSELIPDSVLTGADTESPVLHITEETYIRYEYSSTANSNKLIFGNSNGDLATRTVGAASISYETCLTKSGDVAVRINPTSSAFDDNHFFAFAVVKAKNPGGEIKNAVFINQLGSLSSTTSTSANNVGFLIMICDDTDIPFTEQSKVINDPTKGAASSNFSNFVVGYNNAYKTPKLTRLFGGQSDYSAVNSCVILISPRPYSGKATIGNKEYYCYTFFAFLDE